jgi:hypothetical protein
MNHWHSDGSFNLHVFHKNNELAGYCSVLHAMQIAGSTGDYGRRLRAVVIGFGATARGAVTALNGLGVQDVDVLTHRAIAAVAAPIHSARIVHFDSDDTAARVSHAVTEHGRVRLGEFLAEHDIIVNCVLQDTDAPLTFMTDDDLPDMMPGTLVVDVSCDEAMGFSWARPTTFTDPALWSATRCSTTPSTTARRIYGTPRPGRTARRCCPSSARSWEEVTPGTPTPPFVEPSRSVTGSSRIPPSCPSRAVHRSPRTGVRRSSSWSRFAVGI